MPRHRPPVFRPWSPSPALGARVLRVRPALGRPLPRRRASPGPGRGLSRPHLCPRVHSAPRAEGCPRPLTRISAGGARGGRPETSAASRPSSLPAPDARTRLGRPPRLARGAARRPRGLSPSGPIEALGGKGHSLSRLETTHFPRLRARAGIGFPCARNPASSATPEHPRFSLPKRIKQIGFFLPLSEAVLLDIICPSEVTATKLYGMLHEGSDQKRDCAQKCPRRLHF